MAEIPLIPSTTGNLQPVSQVSALSVGISGDLPRAIALLPVGALLQGKVIGQDERGNYIFKTTQGDVAVTLKGDLRLRVGAELSVRVETNGEAFRGKIVTIDGRPTAAQTQAQSAARGPEVILGGALARPSAGGAAPPLAAAQAFQAATSANALPAAPQAPPAGPAASAPSAFASPAAAPSAPGAAEIVPSPLKGVLVSVPFRPSPASPFLQALGLIPPQLGPGSELTVRLTAITLPPSLPPPAAPEPGSPQGAPPAAQLPPSPAAGTPPPAAPPPPAPKAPSAPGAILGTVSGPPPLDGETLVQTPLGTVKIALPFAAPEGTKLEMAVIDSRPALPPSPQTERPVAQLATLSRSWQSLEEIVTALKNFAPQHAPLFMQRALPQEGARMAGAVIFFVAALRGGGIRHWLGADAFRALEQMGKSELLARASAEFASIRQAFVDPPAASPWQALVFPLYAEGAMQMARLFVRRDPEGEEQTAEKKKRKGSRFVVEVELSALGALQLDGLYREEPQKRFDLILRSHAPLPGEVRAGIHAVFAAAQEETGLAGALEFGVAKAFPFRPMEEVMAAYGNSIIA